MIGEIFIENSTALIKVVIFTESVSLAARAHVHGFCQVYDRCGRQTLRRFPAGCGAKGVADRHEEHGEMRGDPNPATRKHMQRIALFPTMIGTKLLKGDQGQN